MKIHPNYFDWLVYRLFRWRWNPLMRNNPKLRRHFYSLCNEWEQKQVDLESKSTV